VIACQGGGSHTAFTAGVLKRLLGARELASYQVAGLSGTSGVDFGQIEIDDTGKHPMLLIGAVDVLSGEFQTFNSRRDRITPDVILASAAIPNLFRAVRLEGGTYWDGLFSQNPPVRELLDAEPDELWVIQINPQRLETEPTTIADIADRRNELAGNLSLYQELAFIEKIDQLLETGQLTKGQKYKQIVIRVIELSRTRLPRGLGAASKLNRDPRFIQDLMSYGEQQAEEFLAALAFERAWLNQDAAAVMNLFTEDSELVSTPHSPGQAATVASNRYASLYASNYRTASAWT
jgi:NTE family protein